MLGDFNALHLQIKDQLTPGTLINKLYDGHTGLVFMKGADSLCDAQGDLSPVLWPQFCYIVQCSVCCHCAVNAGVLNWV